MRFKWYKMFKNTSQKYHLLYPNNNTKQNVLYKNYLRTCRTFTGKKNSFA